jgi:hypothetical protein
MARCLSFQATYRCGRSGACCTSNWPIPIEADRLARLQAAISQRQLSPYGSNEGWVTSPGPPAILATAAGQCVFYRTDHAPPDCAIHAALGHDALPLACRQFPRVSLLDPDGASVVLSNYCPTAAALLDTPGPVTIVDSPVAFPAIGEYVGLDAREGWPPILRPGVLMDWASWRAFETRAVRLIANDAPSPEDALARLAVIVERVRAWRPDEEPLDVRIDRAFDDGAHDRPAALDSTDIEARVQAIHARIPLTWDVQPQPVTPTREPTGRALRFLTCHAFASWHMLLGEDLRAWLDALRDAHALLAAGFGVREADLWLRHLTPAAGLAADRA